MIQKEQGWILSIDEASNVAGASLWYSGRLVGHSPLKAKRSGDSMSQRLRDIQIELDFFLDSHLPEKTVVKQVIFEGVQARLVMITIGAFLTSPYVDAKLSFSNNFVQSSTWKFWASKRGATGPSKDIKGVKALREVGFPVDEYKITSDDVADSILIYLAWREKP